MFIVVIGAAWDELDMATCGWELGVVAIGIWSNGVSETDEGVVRLKSGRDYEGRYGSHATWCFR